jgi:hypothetical protein
MVNGLLVFLDPLDLLDPQALLELMVAPDPLAAPDPLDLKGRKVSKVFKEIQALLVQLVLPLQCPDRLDPLDPQDPQAQPDHLGLLPIPLTK